MATKQYKDQYERRIEVFRRFSGSFLSLMQRVTTVWSRRRSESCRIVLKMWYMLVIRIYNITSNLFKLSVV